jgi:hypothetical protein
MEKEGLELGSFAQEVAAEFAVDTSFPFSGAPQCGTEECFRD